MEKQPVYRVLYIVKIQDESHPAVADLIFDGEKPFAVLAWTGGDGERHPLVSVPLNAAELSKFDGKEADFVYSHSVEYPDARSGGGEPRE